MRLNGTDYHDKTPLEVAQALEAARARHYRIRLHYGNPETGVDWLEEHDIEGYVGRSCGRRRVPLILANSRSIGGPSVLENCIVKITRRHAGGRWGVYIHPTYRCPVLELRYESPGDLRYRVFADNANVANFRTEVQARRWIKKMED